MIHVWRTITHLAVVLIAFTSAKAHPIIIHAGEVRWEGRELRISLTVDQHLLEHEISALGEEMSAQRIMQALGNSIHVISHDAGQIACSSVSQKKNEDSITCHYDIPDLTTAVALVHRPDEQLGPLPRQFQLKWSRSERGGVRLLRLTSRGNHVVLTRNERSDAIAAIDSFNHPMLRLVTNSKSGMLVQIDYPCVLLATWPGLIDIDDGSINEAQFHRTHDRIADWANARFSIEASDREPQSLSVPRVELLDPTGNVMTGTANRDYSVYTTRIRFQIRYAPTELKRWTTLSWKGFNAAVMRTLVTYNDGDNETQAGVLTPAQTVVRIDHTHPKQITIHDSSPFDSRDH